MFKASSYLKSLFILGCSISLAFHDAAAVQNVRASGPPPNVDGATPLTVKAIDAGQLRELQKSWKGQVVLINLWATWCIPCVKEFPDLSKIQDQYKKQGLKVVGISLDEVDDLESKVKPFLEKHSPSFTIYMIRERDPDKLVSVFDDAWNGMIPNSYIIDRSGKVQKKLLGRKSYEEFEKLLTPLLQPATDP